MAIGETFYAEIAAAGLDGLGIGWNTFTGEVWGRGNLTPAQNVTLQGVIDNHDPAVKTPADKLSTLTPEEIERLLRGGVFGDAAVDAEKNART